MLVCLLKIDRIEATYDTGETSEGAVGSCYPHTLSFSWNLNYLTERGINIISKI